MMMRPETYPEPLKNFIVMVEQIVHAHQEPSDIVIAIEPKLQKLIQNRTWLEPKYTQPIPEKAYAQYLLYLPPDSTFSVVSYVWTPHRGSPIHDHGTWGVIGQYRGEEQETRFRLDNEGRPIEIDKIISKPGSVSHVYPPDRDIHQIRNLTSQPTISIHVYGGDIGIRLRRSYELNSGKISPFISPYDEPM